MLDKLRKTQYIEEILGVISLFILGIMFAVCIIVVRLAMNQIPTNGVLIPGGVAPAESFNLEGASKALGQ